MAISEAEKTAIVSKILMEQKLVKKESARRQQEIENQMYIAREKSLSGAGFIGKIILMKEAEANKLKLTPEFLELKFIEAIADNTKIFFGEKVPNMVLDQRLLGNFLQNVSRQDAGVDRILHLDIDELIYPAGASEYSLRQLLLDVPSNVDMVIFPNYESSVERDDIKDPSSEMIEPDLAFADLNDDMGCATAYLQYVIEDLGNSGVNVKMITGVTSLPLAKRLVANLEWALLT
ncbi:hypothetical protein CRYUN_Cryun12cG0166200 [Craigia yunnanensis]